jgi:hypothetical protein
MNKTEIKQNIIKPLDNFEMQKLLPMCKIYSNKDLNNVENIDELFDKNKYCDFIVLLYLDSPSSGHWVGLSRYGNIDEPKKCFIEFFDSYGGSPQKVYNYTNKEIKKRLDINEDKVTNLLNKCPYNVIYNPVKYQKIGNGINTCGRHLLFRNHNLIQKGRTLNEYYDYMNMLKNKENMSYDEIVSKYVDI